VQRTAVSVMPTSPPAVSEMTRAQTLQQSTMAVLTRVNKGPQTAIQLRK
jgi:flagellin-like hook-associated protein FlgL